MQELKAVAGILKVVFLVFPHYCLGSGLLKLASNHIAKQSLSAFGKITHSFNTYVFFFLKREIQFFSFYKIVSFVHINVYKSDLVPNVEQVSNKNTANQTHNLN